MEKLSSLNEFSGFQAAEFMESLFVYREEAGTLPILWC